VGRSRLLQIAMPELQIFPTLYSSGPLGNDTTGNQPVGVHCCDACQSVEAVHDTENLSAAVPFYKDFKAGIIVTKRGY